MFSYRHVAEVVVPWFSYSYECTDDSYYSYDGSLIHLRAYWPRRLTFRLAKRRCPAIANLTWHATNPHAAQSQNCMPQSWPAGPHHDAWRHWLNAALQIWLGTARFCHRLGAVLLTRYGSKPHPIPQPRQSWLRVPTARRSNDLPVVRRTVRLCDQASRTTLPTYPFSSHWPETAHHGFLPISLAVLI